MTDSNQSLDLEPTLADEEGFLDLFTNPVDIEVNSRTQCKLSVLKIENGEFVLDRLYDALANASFSYVLSRREIADFLADPMKAMKVTNIVRAKFQKPNQTNGEGGEVLLYAMLEAITGAPKLLSKMGLKTNNEMPVFGSDGLHILKVDDLNYQLIFGESKMYGDLGEGISEAFKSMSQVKSNNFIQDTTLVTPQLMRETVSEEQLDYLEEVLMPAPGSGRSRPKPAFGVLLAYDIDVDGFIISEHSDQDIQKHYFDLANNAISSKVSLIKKKIEDYGLGATDFHFFVVPFLKKMVNGKQMGVAESRRSIQRHLRFGYVAEGQDVA